MHRLLATTIGFFGLLSISHGQLVSSISLDKKNYVAGESVIAEIIITNHSGEELTLASTRETPWLTFVVSNSSGNPVSTRKLNAFGAMKIGVGQSLARQVDLSEYFLLTSQGNFAVSAVIRDPQAKVSSVTTNRVLFNLNSGRHYWAQKYGMKKDGVIVNREMKLMTFASGQSTQLYTQVLDGKTGLPMKTYSLGDVLMVRKPMVTLDSSKRMHVMYLGTPSIWVHCQIDGDGMLVGRDFHKRAEQGDPVLMAYGDGSVRVLNSIPYDPKAAEEERKKVRKATDRPNFDTP